MIGIGEFGPCLVKLGHPTCDHPLLYPCGLAYFLLSLILSLSQPSPSPPTCVLYMYVYIYIYDEYPLINECVYIYICLYIYSCIVSRRAFHACKFPH